MPRTAAAAAAIVVAVAIGRRRARAPCAGARGRPVGLRRPRHLDRHLRHRPLPDPAGARLAARDARRRHGLDRDVQRPTRPTSSSRRASAAWSTRCTRRGIRVVAWTLPGHVDQASDLRRMRAMLAFRSPRAASFDGVALDIESLREKDVRSARAGCSRSSADAAAGGGLDARRSDRLPAARASSATHLVAAASRGRSRGGQVDAIVPMLYTGGGFTGLRRHLRVRRSLAASAAERRR